MAYAVVYHMEGYTPQQLRAMQTHHQRAARDTEHCDPSRLHMNEVLHGNRDTWADEFLAEVETVKELNTRNEVAALNRAGRRKQAKRRRAKGGQDPWKSSGTLGPVRSVVLTANAEWFRQKGFEQFEGADFRNPAKVQAFKQAAVAYLDKNIPREHCLFMVFELDESAPHIHAYYRCWRERDTKTKGRQRLLQPTDMVHFRNAEKAQDSVATWFAPLGLVRGENRAEQRRRARKEGRMPPEKRQRMEPWQWRQQERLRLIEAGDMAREEQAKAKARIAAAEAAEERVRRMKKAALDEVEKKREEARRARVEEGKRLREEHRRRTEAVKRREAGAVERDRQNQAREADLERREREQTAFAGKLIAAFDAVKAAAEKFGLKDLELFKSAADKAQDIKDMLGGLGGRQRSR